ncbi:MAG TPA: hypothetical protein VHC47_08725 [Mucilaginibacter sp.]|nr:hypothetical protein [Mucilaginibacter sp.]
MKDIKIIIKKFLVFLFIVAVLDYAIGSGLRKCYFSLKKGDDFRTTYMLDSVRSDILVLGSSRASHHYDTQLISDSLHISAYNGGRDGCFIFYYYALLKSVLSRYHPKMVILDVLPNEFQRAPEAYDRLSILLPYYKSHPEIRPVCQLKSRFEKYKLLSQIYPFNSKLLEATSALLSKQRHGNETLKGYIPLHSQWKFPKPVVKLSDDIDTTKVLYFEKFVSDCNKAHVKLLVSVSPIYINYTGSTKTLDMVQAICKRNHIQYYNYMTDETYDHTRLFADAYHLNSSGATLFTKQFLSVIRNNLN